MGDPSSAEDVLAAEAARAVEEARALQETAAALISRAWNEEQSLRQRASVLESGIKKIESSIRCAPNIDHGEAEKLEEELYRARCVIRDGDVASFLPSKSHGRFLKMFLGPINVRAMRKDVQLKMKEEYNNYRDRTAFLFILFPCILLYLRSWIWDGCFPALAVQLYQAWLLFLYTSLALRENILRVNGSDIRPWWIYHHYCAMLMALISLTWEIKGQPNCSHKQEGVILFLRWAIFQGLVMILQNIYQRKRLYTRIALGKAKRMDVVSGETSGVKGQLKFLSFALFFLQISEACVGLLLLKTAVAGVVSEWQVVACGILLVVMAVGNFVNTVQTLMAKSRFKQRMRRTRNHQG
ncbi:hypothetical protein QJS10_CPB15g00820 [Acorus calamus]|uniref:TMPIT-like protein n=1 Tax=Acorus calamus TaxID=4465 RepID=A0AAV9D8L1_ACOCL|nr:hypothetical protein QJS10_CPB15g00820 [Acorus calamus]